MHCPHLSRLHLTLHEGPCVGLENIEPAQEAHQTQRALGSALWAWAGFAQHACQSAAPELAHPGCSLAPACAQEVKQSAHTSQFQVCHTWRQSKECSKLHSLQKDKMLKAGSIPGSVGCCCIGGCPVGEWAARQISEVVRAGGHWCRRGGQATAASSAPEHHTLLLMSLLHQHICLSSLSEILNADFKAGRASVHRSRGWRRRRLVRRGLQYAGCCLGLVAMPGVPGQAKASLTIAASRAAGAAGGPAHVWASSLLAQPCSGAGAGSAGLAAATATAVAGYVLGCLQSGIVKWLMHLPAYTSCQVLDP